MIGEDRGCAIELFRFALDVLDRPRRADADAVATAVASVEEGRFAIAPGGRSRCRGRPTNPSTRSPT